MSRILFRSCMIFFLIFSFWVIGCDSAKDTFNIGHENKDVQYSINGDQITHNADDESNTTSGTYESKNLLWYCGNYKGQRERYVSLSFRKSGGTWNLTSEYTSDGHTCR